MLIAPAAVLTLCAPLVALAQATALPTESAAALPTSTSSPPTADLLLDGAAVKTANGESWALTVGAGTGTSDLTIELARPLAAGGDELHAWTFPVKSGTFKFSASSGVGTISSGSQTSPVATVGLTFKATAHTSVACSSGSETNYTGTLSGEAELVTGLKAGGTVGGKSVSFTAKGSKPTVAYDNNCTPVSSGGTCIASTIWGDDGGALPAVDAGGISGTFAGKKADLISVERDTALASPKGADRRDVVVEFAAPAVWTPSTKTLSATTPSGGVISGSVTLKGGKESTITEPCSSGTKKYSETLSYDSNAAWTSPAGKAITAHTSLTGNLAAPTSLKTGLYIRTTFKAA